MADRGPSIGSALCVFLAPEIRVWRGKASLRLVFWGYGVVAGSVLAVLFATAYYLNQIALQQTLIVVSALYTVWIVVGIWRCAANATAFWGNLARLLCVAWAMNTAFVLMFLQIDLLATFMLQ